MNRLSFAFLLLIGVSADASDASDATNAMIPVVNEKLEAVGLKPLSATEISGDDFHLRVWSGFGHFGWKMYDVRAQGKVVTARRYLESDAKTGGPTFGPVNIDISLDDITALLDSGLLTYDPSQLS